ncbi:hypothetical protein D1B31_19755 [Neobacillus notoginsengisoli]|uniref:Uncharacterized protein n=1 Tax=Neobacillus notoginsengisoli TaxID=1578198 RepID=A0A417YL19_9BACI|nr:hypothetical protein D1B31_19755 [Neobacillus notoginsengisoli]
MPPGLRKPKDTAVNGSRGCFGRESPEGNCPSVLALDAERIKMRTVAAGKEEEGNGFRTPQL